MIGAQVVAVGKWSMPANAAGLEDGFASVQRMRGILAAWDEPADGRLVISVLVFEPNDETRLDVIDGLLRHFIPGLVREQAPVIADEPVPTADASAAG